ncbi:MAG TPA: hypothetical protein O0X97_06070 [Methanocorpusculum sp.]|nr:hypothetical protein [Methanocorpusculum sp.]
MSSAVKNVGEAIANGVPFENVLPIILLIIVATCIPLIIIKISNTITNSRKEKNKVDDDYDDDDYDDDTEITNYVRSVNNTPSNPSSEITGMQYCMYCGEKLPEDACFCIKCGRKTPQNK